MDPSLEISSVTDENRKREVFEIRELQVNSINFNINFLVMDCSMLHVTGHVY